jgi:DNA-binding transcriptional LysR family regulator
VGLAKTPARYASIVNTGSSSPGAGGNDVRNIRCERDLCLAGQGSFYLRDARPCPVRKKVAAHFARRSPVVAPQARRWLTNDKDIMPQSHIRRYLRHGTLSQMSVFEAVVRRGNFTRAAEEFHLAQPTVSIQLKKLSELVGLPLVEQVGRQVHPTEAGRCVAQACDKVFRTLTELENQLACLRQLNGGRLRLAVGSAARYFAPRLLAAFARRHPDVELSLQIHHREALTERLCANEDDLYIFANPPEGVEIIRQAILPNPLAAFARTDHPLANRKRIPFTELANEPFIVREPGSGTRTSVQRLFEERGLMPKVRMELSSNESIKQAIIAGLGVSILSRHTLGEDTEQPQLTALDVEGVPGDGQWYLVHSLGKQLSPVARAFSQLAKADAERLVEALPAATG